MSKTTSQCDVRPKQFATSAFDRDINGFSSSSNIPFTDSSGAAGSSFAGEDKRNHTGSLNDTTLSSTRGLHRTLSVSSDVVDSESSFHKAFIWSSPRLPSRTKHNSARSKTSLLSSRKGSTCQNMPSDKKVQENIEMLEEFDPSGPLLSSSKKNLCESSHTNTPTTVTVKSSKSKSTKSGGALVLNDDEYSQYVQLSQEMVLEHQIKVKSPFQKGKVIFISGREVILAIGMFFSVTLALGLIFTIVKDKLYPKVQRVPDSTDSTMRHCIAVPELLQNMTDFTQNPCEDFYAYACGGWLKTNDMPSDKQSWDVTDVLISKVNQRVKALLELPPEKYDPDSASWKAHTMYQQCMESEILNSSEALEELMESMQRWQPTELPLSESLVTVQWKYRVAAFFNIWVAPDDKNTSRMIIQFDEGGLNMGSRKDYLQEPPLPKVQAYLDYMKQFSKIVSGIPSNFTQSTFQFEKQLAQIHFEEYTMKTSPASAFYNKLTVSSLTTLSPQIKWLTFLKAAFPEVTGETEVLITSRDYFRQLSRLIDQTPPVILKQYMLWSTVFKYASELSPELQGIFKSYQEKITVLLTLGRHLVTRWQHCVDVVSQWMGAAVGALYVRKYVNSNTVSQVKDILADLKYVFKDTLTKSVWMSSTTKAKALDKLNSLKEVIGYPEEILDEKYLKRLFHNFSVVHGASLLNSSLNGVQYDISVMAQQLKTHKYIDSPATSPHEVSALYTWMDNSILIQVGILQPPHFYTTHIPTVINYGALGSIIGHEMVHGFGITGGQFDKHGKLTMWWSDTSSQIFQTRTNCIAKQYSDYLQEGVRIDGNMTLVENVADIEGLKIAYKGYKKSSKGSDCVDDDLTPEQLFFVAFAQNQCGKFSKEKLVEPNMHTMGRVRVHGTLANIDEFSRAFHCSPGSKMNPRNKCSVWD